MVAPAYSDGLQVNWHVVPPVQSALDRQYFKQAPEVVQ
jgi:hypothetical protein